jgi:hypothetical protein
LTWDNRDGSRAADALPGDDFTAMAFIIQHYFTVPGSWGASEPPEGKSRHFAKNS